MNAASLSGQKTSTGFGYFGQKGGWLNTYEKGWLLNFLFVRLIAISWEPIILYLYYSLNVLLFSDLFEFEKEVESISVNMPIFSMCFLNS